MAANCAGAVGIYARISWPQPFRGKQSPALLGSANAQVCHRIPKRCFSPQPLADGLRMTPSQFIAKWRNAELKERAAAQAGAAA